MVGQPRNRREKLPCGHSRGKAVDHPMKPIHPSIIHFYAISHFILWLSFPVLLLHKLGFWVAEDWTQNLKYLTFAGLFHQIYIHDAQDSAMYLQWKWRQFVSILIYR